MTMSLRAKALIIVHGTAAILVLGIFIAARLILGESFTHLEDSAARASVRRARSALQGELSTLRQMALSWSLNDSALPAAPPLDPTALGQLRLHLILVGDEKGGLAAAHFVSQNGNLLSQPPPGLGPHLKGPGSLLRHSGPQSLRQGLLLLEDSLVLAVSLPRMDRPGQGAAPGALVMGRRLDPAMLEAWGRASQARLDLRRLGDPGLTAGEQSLAQRLGHGEEVITEPQGAQWMQGAALLRDLRGEPVAMLQVRTPRLIWRQAEQTLFCLLAALLGAGLVVILVSLLVIEHFLTRPLSRLGSQVARIARGGDPGQRLGLQGQDEVGRLALEIDAMLDSLERNRQRRREAEDLYQALTETAASGIFIMQGKRFLYINPAGQAICGYPLEHLNQAQPWETVHPRHRDELRRQVKSRLAKGSVVGRYEFEIIHPIKGDRWVEITINQIVYQGRPALLGTAFDITDRKTADEALREAEERYRTLFERAGDAIFIMRGQYIVGANHAAAQMHGYTRDELLGMNLLDLYPPQHRELTSRNLKLAHRGQWIKLETEHQRKDGSVFAVEVSAGGILLGGQHHVLAFDRDITDRLRAESQRRALEAQLRQAQKMEAVGTLAGGIAHDFNNILQAIGGYLQLAAQVGASDAKQAEYLHKMQGVVDRAAQTVQQLLAFSRKVEPELKPINLNQQVERAAQMLRPSLPKMIVIATSLGPELALVNGDANQLEQVLINLATNAGHAMPEGGTLTISTRNVHLDEAFCQTQTGASPGPHVCLSVSDTGHGMDQEIVAKIFEPFFTTKSPGKGTGLGLAMVYGIVQAHGGIITCQSKPGQGSLFSIFLPVLEDSLDASGEIPRQEPRPHQGRETVLLVDDEEAILEASAEAFGYYGYRVYTATSGEEALDLLESLGQTVDLVVLDLDMPGMGGIKALGKIIRRDPLAKVIICSGYSDNEKAATCRTLGAADFVAKPYHFSQLLGAVRKLLDQ